MHIDAANDKMGHSQFFETQCYCLVCCGNVCLFGSSNDWELVNWILLQLCLFKAFEL